VTPITALLALPIKVFSVNIHINVNSMVKGFLGTPEQLSDFIME
jgi:amino acid permease